MMASNFWRVSLGVGAMAALWMSGVAAAEEASTRQAELVKRGEYVARTADCVACHTTDHDKPFAGGLPMGLPMGNIYSTNITPDKDTGIGSYTLEEFTRVLREGVTPDRGNLYPAMPYPSYTKMTDDEIEALYAYFMHGVQPIHQENKAPDFYWPLTIRWPLKIWNWMFLDEGAYQPKAGQSDEWNRGAYLVQGPAHCGTCHTPRGLAMQERAYDETGDEYLAGADIASWHAFNITSDINSGIGGWSTDELVQYLKDGNVRGKGQAGGQMGEAVEHSFSHMTDADLHAIAVYMKTVPAVNDGDTRPRYSYGTPGDDFLRLRAQPVTQDAPSDRGARVYLENCAACHRPAGQGSPDGYYPSMFHNSVIGTDYHNNLINVVLDGVKRKTPGNDVLMPAFRDELSDEDIAALANYLSQQFGRGDMNVTPKSVKALRND